MDHPNRNRAEYEMTATARDLKAEYELRTSDHEFHYRVSSAVPPAVMRQLMPILERGVTGDRIAVMISTDGRNVYIGSTTLWRASDNDEYDY